MVRMINRVTGTEMFVADSRVEEHLAAGHKLAAEPVKEEPAKAEKKATKKKK